MRTIKFRGQSLYTKHEWLYGSLLQFKNQFYIVPNVEKIDLRIYRVIPETVGQFTGLLDKNGVEIYEGDKIKIGENLLGEIKYIESNQYDIGNEISCAYHVLIENNNKIIPFDSYISYLVENCKVIGNIHEI